MPFEPDINLARRLILEQFPEHAHLAITSVAKQGHDNRTYRLGTEMLIRMPTAASYALKVSKEQELLPKLAPYLGIDIPKPIAMGVPSEIYLYPFSIYKWLKGKSLNLLILDNQAKEQLASALAKFLKQLRSITEIAGPEPGQHNYWRGDHPSVYDEDAREQIAKLTDIIDADKSIDLWQRACQTRWHKKPVWVHGDMAIGNILLKDNELSAVIDFGGMGMGDPACDLAMAWTYFEGKARDIFISEINLDEDTFLRARGWVLWKTTYELCNKKDKNSFEYQKLQKIIDSLFV